MKPSRKALTVRMGIAAAVFLIGGGYAIAHRAGPYTATPEVVIVSLAGQAPELTGQEDGVRFDLNGDGVPEYVAWTQAGRSDALLAVDENHDGQITSGFEVVGSGVSGPAGFAYFEAFDEYEVRTRSPQPARLVKGTGYLDRSSALFKRLVLWTDLNHDGVSQEDELQSLAYAGFSKIDIASKTKVGRVDAHGNQFTSQLTATRLVDGSPVTLTFWSVILAGANEPVPVHRNR